MRGAPKLTEACPRHAWQELLWKKPPLRTSTCGRHRFRRNHPLWEPRMWQGQVWEARPDGESTRGKAKFGKRHGSRKWEEENSATRRRHRGKGRETAENPLPPIQCATHPDAPADAGEPLRRTTADAKNHQKMAADAFPAFEKYKVMESNPALRMPKWGMWYIVWGEGVFCRSLPFPRQRLHVPCLFPNLALPRVDSPSGLASQTWPCHILQ